MGCVYGTDSRMMLEQFASCRRLLIALGDETRQTIVAVLAGTGCDGGMRVGEITEKTHLSRPAVSHHIRILLDAEVIGLRRQGTMNFYHLKLGGAWGELVSLVNHIEELRKRCEYPVQAEAEKGRGRAGRASKTKQIAEVGQTEHSEKAKQAGRTGRAKATKRARQVEEASPSRNAKG
ncbi:MAG: metalloregulator ArsR/SmtB family transcription factor [Coriobacteriales bacterium]|jgi:ArsR family transcriptional regulator|nr:metalloregulator ArsR/SmtB family transcription factor [Coriobacteriales bacterium]